MLDQNTDRMWYVIGAVIVGAALIFLMNGVFPTLFANIGDTFEDKVDQTTEMTDGIRPVRQNLMDMDDITQGQWISQANGTMQSGDDGQYYSSSGFIPITSGRTYRFTGNDGLYNPRMTWFDKEKRFISGFLVVTIEDRVNRNKASGTAPANAAYLRVSALDASTPGAVEHMKAKNQPSSVILDWRVEESNVSF